MSTPYSVLIKGFLKRIENDRKFFNYIQLTDNESMLLAMDRSNTYLKEAVGQLTLKCNPQVDFEYNDKTQEFTCDFTNKECFLIISLMYEMYLSRDISTIKTLNVNFTSTDLRVFDPSNARTSFMEIYEFVCLQNALLIQEYKNRDRISGALKGIDYSVDVI